MLPTTLAKNSLVLYKNQPARVKQISNKLEIELIDGKTVKVRSKDVQLLHQGPIKSLQDLTTQTGEVETAWELLAGEITNLVELAELIYDIYTPATAWATWQLLMDGLYFYGSLESITVRTEAEVETEQSARKAKIEREQAWGDFLKRIESGKIIAEDKSYMQEIEELALEKRSKSRIFRYLKRAETPENAHALLLKLNYWDYTKNPYPHRLEVITELPTAELPTLNNENRVDLTHLPAYAIDDEGSKDPDDALSLTEDRLWVHVADVAALVLPKSFADEESRSRGANLYLPEGTLHMLPEQATKLLGLGLDDVSPALSFGLTLDAVSNVVDVEIVPSWVKVQRFTYDEVEMRLTESPFTELYQLAQQVISRREANGSISIELPEVKVRVNEGQVSITPLPALKSRDLVREAMLLCGEGVAQFAQQANIPLPFSTQPPPEDWETLDGLAGMFSLRRSMKPSELKSVPGSHAGLGLDLYVQATSPLRRYLDLVVHQQLRAYIQNKPMLTEQEILNRVGAAQAATANLRRAERLSRKHWTLVYLMQNPDWQGEGILVEKRGNGGIVLIPELDLEFRMHLRQDLPLNSVLSLAFNHANLPELDGHFQVL